MSGRQKLKRSARNRKSGKSQKQFERTVKKTGKWRGVRVENERVVKPVIKKKVGR